MATGKFKKKRNEKWNDHNEFWFSFPHSPSQWFPQTIKKDIIVAMACEDSHESEFLNELVKECDDLPVVGACAWLF